MRNRSIATALVALGATALLLTGCSQEGTDHSEKKPSASATPSDGITRAPYDNACDGDQAVISGDGGKHELAKGCKAVAVVASGSEITLGDAESIIVEGSNNKVTVSKTTTVTFFGSNNELHVQGDAPQVDDQGTGNEID